MREKRSDRMRAKVEMSSVLASPGTPTRRQLPPEKSATASCSTTSLLTDDDLRDLGLQSTLDSLQFLDVLHIGTVRAGYFGAHERLLRG